MIKVNEFLLSNDAKLTELVLTKAETFQNYDLRHTENYTWQSTLKSHSTSLTQIILGKTKRTFKNILYNSYSRQ